MKIASFNVNSIKMRVDIVADFLKKQNIDVLFLQEIKCLEENFPKLDFTALGYECHILGQKAYNGVAILSKVKLNIVATSLTGLDDPAARIIWAKTESGISLICVYVPNGNPVETEKFDYKLKWLAAFYKLCEKLIDEKEPFIIGGDYNIIPRDIDAYDIDKFKNDALYHPLVIKIFRKIIGLGITEVWQVFNQAIDFTYYDFFARNLELNRGLRIDHFLVSPEMADKVISCVIDKEPRFLEKPSDHTPIILEFDHTN